MGKRTLAETLVAGILAIGGKEVNGKSWKYRTFLWESENGRPITLYVGPSGALRASQTGKVTESLSCGSLFRKRVLDAGSKALGATPSADEMLADLS